MNKIQEEAGRPRPKHLVLGSSSSHAGIQNVIRRFWLSDEWTVDPNTLAITHPKRASPTNARVERKGRRFLFVGIVHSDGVAAAKRTRPVEVVPMLIVSTGHVKDSERAVLDRHYDCGNTGWLIPLACPAPEIVNQSEGLAAVLRTAREAGCTYVLFDRDADAVEGIPTYVWGDSSARTDTAAR